MAFGYRPNAAAGNPALEARRERDQQTAMNRQSSERAAAEVNAARPNMRAGVTPGMGADEVRFTQAKNVQQYQNDQRGTQNHAAGINYGMSTQEARATQAQSVRQASGAMAAYTPPGSQGGYASYGQAAPQATQRAPNATPPATQFAGGSPGDWRNVGQTPPAAGSQAIPSMQPPAGAVRNDLSGQVPSNQVYAQAFNQASEQVGSPNRATSYTMPGTRTSRSLNPATGQYSEPQTQQSFDGNMAYNAIDNRPGPIQARATGIDGSAMPWQDALSQREAFTGGLVERLGQYQSGAQTGRPDINPGQLLNQANERLADGSFNNPFSQGAVSQRAPASRWSDGYFSQQVPYGDSTFQGYGAGQNPDVQRAMGNANQYMQGSFQNPFGDSQQANNPQPSFNQQSYNGFGDDMAYGPNSPAKPTPFAPVFNAPAPPDYTKPYDPTDDNAAAAAGWQKGIHGGAYNSKTGQYWDEAASAPWGQQPSAARPIEPPSQGTPYNPQAQVQGLPDVPQARRGEGPRPTSADYTSPVVTPERQRAIDGENARSEQARQAAMAGMQPPGDRQQAQLAKIDKEINQWERATYGTRKGSGPPAEWRSHIQALKRLRTKAESGDSAALAWNPKMKAPAANVTPTVPLNRRGSEARFGPMRKNGG